MYDILKLFILSITLLVASVQDLRVQKVINKTWIPALIAGTILVLLQTREQFFVLPLNWFIGYVFIMLVGILISCAVAWILYRCFKFGKADSYGIIVMGIMYAAAPWLTLTSVFIACISSTTIGIKFKRLPWIPCLLLGFLGSIILFGGI